MAFITIEGIIEDGQVRLQGSVTLPEHTKVYVVVPHQETTPQARVRSPRLARPEQASDFAKEIIEVDDADV